MQKKGNGAGPTRFGADTDPRSSREIEQSNAVAQEFAASGGTTAKPDNAEDYWSPQGRDQGVFEERLGSISPVPEHDGTECLKWDDSLWSHADHFRVSLFKSVTFPPGFIVAHITASVFTYTEEYLAPGAKGSMKLS